MDVQPVPSTLPPGQQSEPRPRLGSIELVCGCMFAGKTQLLIERVRRQPPKQVACFKHRRDDRYWPDHIVSHGQDSAPAVAVDRAEQIPPLVKPQHQLVVIDEGQFFDVQLAAVCQQLAQNGHEVLIAGLDLNSWGRPFPTIEAVEQVADRKTALTACCARCGNLARCTQRLTPIIDGHMVGGSEAFEPRCPACWSPPPEDPVD